MMLEKNGWVSWLFIHIIGGVEWERYREKEETNDDFGKNLNLRLKSKTLNFFYSLKKKIYIYYQNWRLLS